MAIPHAAPGMPVDLRQGADSSTGAKTTALVKNDRFEAIRLMVPRGHEVCHSHQIESMITVQCLEGRVAFTADGDTRELSEGHWLFLPGGVPHTIAGLENAVVLLTVLFD